MSRETVYLPSFLYEFTNCRENRRTQLLLQESLFYVLQIAVSITISVIDTIWLSMFRRKFIFRKALPLRGEKCRNTINRSITPFFFVAKYLHRSTVSNTVTKYLSRLSFFLNFLAFFLSCTRPFLSSTSLILSLSFSLPLFLSHSAHIQLVEKLRQLLHVIFSRRSISSLPIVFCFLFIFFFFGLHKILPSLEFLNS